MLIFIDFMRIQDFFSGGRPGPAVRKQSGQRFLFSVLNLFYSLHRGSNGLITEKTLLLYFSKDPEGVQNFPGRGGVQLCFQGVIQMLISIETHTTCDI